MDSIYGQVHESRQSDCMHGFHDDIVHVAYQYGKYYYHDDNVAIVCMLTFCTCII